MDGVSSDPSAPRISEALWAIFSQAQVEGRVGPGSIAPQIDHALAFAEVLRNFDGVQRILDLGSGGGLPGLVVAEILPDREVTLLDGRSERARALEEAVETLAMGARVHVVGLRAEEAGRGGLRGQFDAVVARSFAKPAVVAECAAPFLRQGGSLLVSEPPDREVSQLRWPMDQIAEVGLELLPPPNAPFAFVHLRQVSLCPDRFPRRTGMPSKRPLF